MTIADLFKQDKGLYKGLLLGTAILLAGTAGIGTGLLLAQDGAGKGDKFWIEQLPANELASNTATSTATSTAPESNSKPETQAAAAAASTPTAPVSGEVVASKTGTVYYLPTCSGVSRIKPENRTTYPTRAAAEAKGLKPAKNCKGL